MVYCSVDFDFFVVCVGQGRRSVYDKQQERLYRVEARVETITPSGGGLVLDERHLVCLSPSPRCSL